MQQIFQAKGLGEITRERVLLERTESGSPLTFRDWQKELDTTEVTEHALTRRWRSKQKDGKDAANKAGETGRL